MRSGSALPNFPIFVIVAENATDCCNPVWAGALMFGVLMDLADCCESAQ